MIFVTVGTQLPFDRMIRTVDAWAGRSGADVFAQIGSGHYVPRHVRWARTLPGDEFNAQLRQAQAVVAHAGMGSILTALQFGKPILVLPRCGSVGGEHRNDHQLATAKHFLEQGRIRVAFNEAELESQLDDIATIQPSARITGLASPALIDALRSFARTAAVRTSASSRQEQEADAMTNAAVARM
jgi:UDP-N-acetylglucosamine transferase subunit ALG13